MRSAPSLRPALILVALGLLLPLCGCGRDREADQPRSDTGRPVIQAVNYPLAYFAERIAGNRLDIQFLAPPGEDPAHWLPTDDAVSAFQSAELILLNGAGYAHWTSGTSLPRARCVLTTAGVKDRLIEQPADTSHAHGPEGQHTHGRLAFTTWLDFTLATEQARAVRGAFGPLLAEQGAQLDQALADLEKDLRALDEELLALSAAHKDQPMLASHPVYQYLAERYQLNLKSLHWEPGDMPSEAEWAKLRALGKEHPATVMLWEDEPTDATRKRLEARGLRVVVFNPCANRPENGDFLSVMHKNVSALRTALSK